MEERGMRVLVSSRMGRRGGYHLLYMSTFFFYWPSPSQTTNINTTFKRSHFKILWCLILLSRTDSCLSEFVYVRKCRGLTLCLCLCYFSKRQKIHFSALRVWSVDEPHPQEEVSFKSTLCVGIFRDFVACMDEHKMLHRKFTSLLSVSGLWTNPIPKKR